MKRHGNLWPTLTSFEHLLKSSEKAKRGKRFRSAVARYEFNLERETAFGELVGTRKAS